MLSLCLALGLGGSAILQAQPADNSAIEGERLVVVRIGTLKGSLDPNGFSPNGRYLFTQQGAGPTPRSGPTPPRIWSVPDLGHILDLKRGPDDAQTPGPLYNSRTSVAVTATLTSLVEGGYREESRVWSLPGWKRGKPLPGARAGQSGAISPDGRFLLAYTRTAERYGMGFWLLPEGRFLKLLPEDALSDFCQFSPTMPIVATAGQMTQAEVAANPQLKELVGEKLKAVGVDFVVPKILLWSVPDYGLVATLPGASGIGFSRDGRTLACYGPKGGVTLWSVPEGKSVASFGDDGVGAVVATTSYKLAAFSPDGRYVACQDDKSTRVWSVRDRKLVTINTAGRGSGLVFSPDGLILATAPLLWSVRSGKLLATLPGSNGIAFSPDGRTLASNGNDGVSVWLYARGGDVDWSRDKVVADRRLQAEAKLSIPASVYAGDVMSLDVTVRNSGNADCMQLWAGADAGSLQLRQLTALIGRVKPGATIQRRVGVVLPVEHKTGKIKGTLVFREAEKKTIGLKALPFVIEVKPLPRPDFTLLAKPAELKLRRGQELDVPVLVKNETGEAIADLRVTVRVLEDNGRVMLKPASLEFGTVANNAKAERRVAIEVKNDAPAGPVTFDLRAGDELGRVFAVQQFTLPVKE